MEKMSKYQRFHEDSSLFLRYKVDKLFSQKRKILLKDKPQLKSTCTILL
jgi:hypothetical protein